MRSRTLFLTRLVLLTAITLSFEMIGLPQPLTGPLVNLMLILTTLVTNAYGGMTLGAVTPLIALMRGQLPPVLAPFVPFIIAGNVLFVLIFSIIRRRSTPAAVPGFLSWTAVILGACGKFAWLFLSARFLLQLIVSRTLPEHIIGMMAFPQLITALIGGGLALIFYTQLVRRRIISPPKS